MVKQRPPRYCIDCGKPVEPKQQKRCVKCAKEKKLADWKDGWNPTPMNNTCILCGAPCHRSTCKACQKTATKSRLDAAYREKRKNSLAALKTDDNTSIGVDEIKAKACASADRVLQRLGITRNYIASAVVEAKCRAGINRGRILVN